MQGVAKELSVDRSMVIWHLKQIGMVKKLDKWMPCELTRNLKNHHFEVLFTLSLCNNNKSFLDWIVMCSETITSKKYAQQLSEMHQKLRRLQLALVKRKDPVLLHNAWPCIAQPTLQKFNELGHKVLPHLPYSPASAAAAAKSLQSCPTLCNPTDGSPPGSPVPGILQARTLKWAAISFSNAWKWKGKGKSLSRVWLFGILWTSAYQAPPSMGFSRQEYWSGVPSPDLSPTDYHSSKHLNNLL